MASNKARAYFGLVGYHFDPRNVTELLGLQPTATDDAGSRSTLDKPVISSWEMSTDSIEDSEEELDVYHLTDEFVKELEPHKDKIIEVCTNMNLSPRLGVVMTLSTDKNATKPAVGCGARTIRFLADISAFFNVDYQFSD